tara:strand:- start:831 stop:1196 length:366 start_codon:yes stop_codon:yes gene_type:complete
MEINPKNKSWDKIWDILKKDFRKFKSRMLDEDETMMECFEDPIYAYNLFCYSIVDDPKYMKIVKNMLLKKGIPEKHINNFFYTFLKMQYKTDEGLWSFNEMMEMNLDFEDVKKTTTKYCFA